MAGAGGGLRVWGSFVLLSLCGWTGATAAAPNPVRSLSVEARSNSSLSLRWEVPEGPDAQGLTYWVQCTGDGGRNETHNTTDTRATVDGLDPASRYQLSVWAEKDAVPGPSVTLNATTAPNPVRSLSVEARSNSSLSLRWEVPEGPDAQGLTYWVQCTGDGGRNETHSTTDTRATVDGLDPASRYQLSVWAEKDTVPGPSVTLNATTAPNPVRSPSVEARSSSSLSLRWEVPEGPDAQGLTYWVQCTGDGGRNETHSTTDTRATVDGLDPASRYQLSVWAEKDAVPGPSVTLNATTAPNPVRSLSVEARSSSSLSLRWEVPEGPDAQGLTYWVQCTGDGGRNETHSTTDTRATVDGLDPASRYQLSVWAEKDAVPSPSVTLNATTAPNPVRSPSVEARSNSSLSLRWEVPEGPDAQGLTYWVQCTGDGGRNETHSTTDTRVTVDGLDPASRYQLSVWAEKDAVPGPSVTLNATTVPNAVASLRTLDQTNSSITLNWTAPVGPMGPPYTYHVSWVEAGSSDAASRSTSGTSITLTALEAGSLYHVTIWAERNEVRGYASTLTEATAPNEVLHLQNTSQTNNSVTLRWQAPADPHSLLYTYWVQWASEERPQRAQDPTRAGAQSTDRTNETCYEVAALQPGTLYTFSVRAERESVASSAQSLQASTAPDSVAITSCVSTSGGYGVILTWPCPSGDYEAFEWEVGGQRGSQDGSSCGKDVSVLGLGPAQSYRATVTTISNGMRAPSVPVTCSTESAASAAQLVGTEVGGRQDLGSYGSPRLLPQGVIAGAIVGVLLFLILVGLLVFFLRKRNKKHQEKEAPKDLEFRFPGDILAQDFGDHVRKNEKDSNCGFAEEYQQLGLEGHGQPQMVALAPENKAKNRYGNVLPYDWSRVPLEPLQEEPGSDYINASFIPGLWSPREFIAAQGPLPQTVGDFWRLVWEQQSHTLVMLTNCMESGRVKCEHYWPLDARPCTHGDLQVTLVGEAVMENWTVRDLQLLHTEEQKTLSVRQFHYLAWPDHGVPHTDPLLAFWKVLRQWLDQTSEGGPPIVHCSAGVGRTGTLIALDVLLRQLECEGLVGPFSFVRKMRESRPLMVQTEAQYVFLHQCILRFLQQSDSAPASSEATYENVAKLTYENVAALQAHELEV